MLKQKYDMNICTILTFGSHEDFLAYKNTVKIRSEQVGISENSRTGEFRIAIVIKTETPIPNGSLLVKTKEGREMTIRVSSVSEREVAGLKSS